MFLPRPARLAIPAGNVTLGLLVAACGGDDDDASATSTTPTTAASEDTTTPTTAASEDTTAPTTTATTTTAAQPVTSAEEAIARLQASGLPLTNVVVYDETTDPNSLLGRPHQYIGKANWLDGRDDDDDSNTYSVEVFDNEDDLNARKEYVETVTGSVSAFCEYDTVLGLVLLRLSCHLTPVQAQEYADALDA